MVRGRATGPCLLLLVLVAAGCSSSPSRRATPRPTPAPTSTSTTAPSAPGGYPLTGLPIDDPRRAARPALTVKIENEPLARPQSGLQAADVVYEELIEGGDTRFVAIFQSTDADPVGSIRSVRPTDPFVVGPVGGLFAYSGGTAKFVAALHSVSIVDVGVSAAPGAYFQRPEKAPDHRLFSSTPRLYAAPGAAGAKPPPPLFTFVPPGSPFAPSTASPASHVDVLVGIQHVAYDWDPAVGWRRSIGGRPHVVEGGAQLAPTNVIVQFVSWVPSPGDVDTLGSPVVVAQLVGAGDAWILSGGKVVKGHWAKANRDAVTTYTGPDNQPIALTPGRTWVELAPTGTPATVR